MQDNKISDVPYIVYEGEQARNERHIKRLIIALAISICLLFASNIAWLIAWCQYDYSSVDIESNEGYANYIGKDGNIYNGEDTGPEEDAQKREVKGNTDKKEET